jgi:DsbC/DsbD-like thiol-disulfide interchange protein
MQLQNGSLRFAVAMVLLSAPLVAQAQIVEQSHSASTVEAVRYLFPEQVNLPAGKPTEVALHFRVEQGLHINSHTPAEDFLIPTTLTIPEDSGVRLAAATYPPGMPFTFPLDPKTKLIVYSGEFVVQARIVSTPGNHLVEAKLRYQACDNHACMPPKTIVVAIDVIGK